MSESNAIPPGWEITPLGELVHRLCDGSHIPPPKQPSGFPMLSAKNIQNGEITYDGRFITESSFKIEDQRTNVRPGDVLLTIVGTIGRAAVVPESSPRFTLQRSVAVVKPIEILSIFLMYHFQSPCFQRELAVNARGTAQKGVYLKTLNGLTVLVAPLPEQRRIVAKIEELFSDLDAGVVALERAQANLKRYRAAVLKAAVEGKLTEQWRAENPDVEPASELLRRILAERRERWEAEQLAKYEEKGKKPPKGWQEKYKEPAEPDVAGLPDLPKGWCWATLDQLIVYGPQNGLYLPQSAYGSGVPIIRIDDFQNDWSRPANELRRVRASEADSSKYALKITDIVINRVNSMSHLGKAIVIKERHLPSLFESNMMRLTLATDCSAAFVVRSLQSVEGRARMLLNAKQAVNQASINQDDVRGIVIPLPPSCEQFAIANVIDERFSVVDRLSESCSSLQLRASRLRQSILKRAFEGKLVPQDPNDEPASELLARIKAERDVAANGKKTTARSKRTRSKPAKK